MKILYLHQYFTTPSMAGGTRSYEMARRLVAWGHEVHMITTDREGWFDSKQKWHQTEEAGIHVHWTPIPYSNKMSYSQRIKAFFAFSWRAARKAAKIGGDIVFATSTPLTIAIPGVYASKRLKIPMVFEIRDLWPEVPIAIGALKNPLTKSAARWLEHFAYRNASHIVALAPGMKEYIASKGYPREKITVIPNGADVELFDVSEETGKKLRKQYDWLGDRPLVVYTGTLGIINGVELLVDLAEAVKTISNDVRFAVIGSGREEDTIKEYAKSRKVLGDNFFMLERIPKDQIPRWLSAATACAVFFNGPEIFWKHSVPNKFFDCLAAKKPFISNIRGWSQTIGEEKGAGIIVDMSFPKKAGEILVEFLHDKQRLYQASHSAETLAEKQFNRTLLAEKLDFILKKVRLFKSELL